MTPQGLTRSCTRAKLHRRRQLGRPLSGLAAALLMASSASACSGTSGPLDTLPSSAPSSSSIASASPRPLGPVAKRCGGPNPVDARLRTLTGPDGSRLPVVDIGAGSTVAIFVHQTDGDGLCGFCPYAVWVASQTGVRSVLFDLCSFGSADCHNGSFADDQLAQLALAVAYARAIPGVRRTVLVGASMGGALALAAAGRDRVDAVVDLSGPPDWTGAPAAAAAGAVRVPCLVVASPNDSDADYGGIRAAFEKVKGTPKRFVVGAGPHGWDLLGSPDAWTPLATTVAAWIKGNYRAAD
jgi:pimeloyl-ACP methyl ester carboxylesterase